MTTATANRGGRHHGLPRDVGVSLVEVLVAVVLMGIGVAAVLGALGVSIRGSSTHETKVVGLSVLETAAAALTEQIEPCDDAAYTAAARAAIPLDGWEPGGLGNPAALTVTAECGNPDLHTVELSYVRPGGGFTETLRLTIGGPTAAPPPTVPAGDDDGPFGDNTCRVVTGSVVASPATMVWDLTAEWGTGVRTLDQDVIVSVGLTGNCGVVEAVLTAAGGDEVTLPMNPPSASTRTIEVTGRSMDWDEGRVSARFVHVLATPLLMNSGATFETFAVDHCLVGAVTVSPDPILLVDGRPQLPTTVSASPSTGVCDGVTVDITSGGSVVLTNAPVTDLDGTLSETLTFDPTSPEWSAGTATAVLHDRHGNPIGTTDFTVTVP